MPSLFGPDISIMLLAAVILCGLCCRLSIVDATLESLVQPDDASIVENINDIVDQIVPDIARQIKAWNMDPLEAGNLRSRDLSDCQVEGLSTLYRSGNCYFTAPNDRNGLLQANIGFDRITGTCQFAKKVFFYTHRGTIQMRIPNVTTFIRISQAIEPTAHPVLEYVDVTVPKGMSMEVFGSDTVNLMLDAVQIFYRRRMSRTVEEVLRERIQEILLSYLSKITLEDINTAFSTGNHLVLFNDTLTDIQ